MDAVRACDAAAAAVGFTRRKSVAEWFSKRMEENGARCTVSCRLKCGGDLYALAPSSCRVPTRRYADRTVNASGDGDLRAPTLPGFK